jgi:diguanylate cyclase (GGDEF)-like protein
MSSATHDLLSMLPLPEGLPRMLIIDDQPANIQVLYRLFANDFQVFMATSGEQGLEIARQENPDIILLDVVMPEMDGFETCSQLKQDGQTSDIPVLFVTAHQNPDEETRALEMGGVDFITKPINPAVVRARVKTHLTLKRQTDTFKRLVFIDGLTGTFNRRYFDTQLTSEFARAARSRSSLGLILVDVDHFKLFNDHYGHQAGDDCLRAVARALRHTLWRPGDAVARYGGEEFACILPDTDLEGALMVAQRMADAVRALGLAHESSSTDRVVTISAGVSVLSPGPGGTPGELVALADEQLYKAKAGGRAQVCGQHAQAATTPLKA